MNRLRKIGEPVSEVNEVFEPARGQRPTFPSWGSSEDGDGAGPPSLLLPRGGGGHGNDRERGNRLGRPLAIRWWAASSVLKATRLTRPLPQSRASVQTVGTSSRTTSVFTSGPTPLWLGNGTGPHATPVFTGPVCWAPPCPIRRRFKSTCPEIASKVTLGGELKEASTDTLLSMHLRWNASYSSW